MKSGILLINLGTPDSLRLKDLKTYLKEFLMDKKVISLPYLLRYLLVNLIIIPLRIKKSRRAYQKIWFEDGSPLLLISQRLSIKLEKKIGQKVYLAMRYGSPSLESVLKQIKSDNINTLKIVPMYPHYAMSSFETAIDKFEEQYKKNGLTCKYEIVEPFFDHPEYIKALSQKIKPYLNKDYDHILFSYHGIPVSHITKLDKSNSHCLKEVDCCEKPQHMKNFCYRHQVFATTAAVATKLAIPQAKYSLSFQSRLANEAWLDPYTDKEIIELAQKGCKKLLVVCPSFLTECLETLEEIAIRGKESFLENSRKSDRNEYTFEQIPCLNDSETWVNSLIKIIK